MEKQMMKNTKVRMPVSQFSGPGNCKWEARVRTIWESHTGVKCVKMNGGWRTVRIVVARGAFAMATLQGSRKYTVPKLRNKRSL